MKVAFRCDASTAIGSGHVLRCATLAKALQKRGVEVSFVCRELHGNYCDWLEAQSLTVHRLPAPAVSEPVDLRLAHAAWLGVTQARDAAETRAAIDFGRPEWLIVDSYSIDSEWETALRPVVRRLMAVDDLADRRHDVDILLDQNLQSRPDRYAGLLAAGCLTLVGPRFALLRAEFSQMREVSEPRTGVLTQVLVFLGGSDPHNLTALVLDALRQSNLPVQIDVILGSTAPHLEAVRQLCNAMPSSRLHVDTPNMAELLARADFAIGAPGSSTWERCCLGVPSLLLPFAENQFELGLQVVRRRLGVVLSDPRHVTAGHISRVLRLLAQRPSFLKRISQRARSQVDGKGAARIAAVLTATYDISIACDADSWINEHLPALVDGWRQQHHRVSVVHDVNDIPTGDIAFYVGCSQITSLEILRRNVHNLVVHESALPHGRGWSPLTWQILEGKSKIPISLIEATERVDAGEIYLQREMQFGGYELVSDLRRVQAEATIALCREFVATYPAVVGKARPQNGKPTYYRRRRSVDSRLDPDKSLAEQFDLLRTVDNDRYPAHFEYRGHRYRLAIAMEGCPE